MISVLNIFLILNVLSSTRAFSYIEPNYEEDYYREVQISQFLLQNILCDATRMSIYQQIAVCQDLFQRFAFGSIWNAHLNKRAFENLIHPDEPCAQQQITWKKIRSERDWLPTLLTCYAQHKPIRTSHTQDDYYETFFLTSGLDARQMYLFMQTVTSTAREIVLLAKYTLDAEPTDGMLMITSEDVQEDEYLTTIETRNFDVHEVETIYVLDMMQRTDAFEHPLHDMERGHLITVCFSVFSGIVDTYHGAQIDLDGMFAADQIKMQRQVVFQFEITHPPNMQQMYSCQAKGTDGIQINDMGLNELFYMSPGRRPRSVFAYKHVGSPDFVKLLFYVENFDFENLQPSHPSETEVRISNRVTAMDVSSS